MFPGFAGGHAEGGAAHSVHRGAARVREDPREAAGDREAEQRAHEARVRLGEETSLRTSQQGDAGVKQDLFPILSSSETDILKGKNFILTCGRALELDIMISSSHSSCFRNESESTPLSLLYSAACEAGPGPGCGPAEGRTLLRRLAALSHHGRLLLLAGPARN